VLLLEKEAGPRDKVCGEFLSAEAVRYLRLAGIDLDSLGAVPISHVRLGAGASLAEARLPLEARSVSRRVLDEALLREAQEAGATVRRGKRVQSLARVGSSPWQVQLETGDAHRGHSAFLCTGKHDLQGWPRGPGKQNTLIAFKMHWRLSPPSQRELRDAVELFVFRGGYAGLESVENGVANLALLVERQTFLRLKTWPELLRHMSAACPHLARRLTGAEPLWKAPLAAYGIPYGYVQRSASNGAWRLGDQAGVIPSFAGSGISLALHSAARATASVLAAESESLYRKRLQREISTPIGLATWISRMLLKPHLSRYSAGMPAYAPHVLRLIADVTRISQA
jgi:flavin-dependent dehydrogenase